MANLENLLKLAVDAHGRIAADLQGKRKIDSH